MYKYNEDNNTQCHSKQTIFTVEMQRNRIIYFNSVGVQAVKNFKQFVAASRWRRRGRGGMMGRLPQQNIR